MLSLPEGTEMFQFPSLASGTYGFSAGSRGFAAGGFPIRTSPGQSLFGGSPELIAACHVLRRLLTPGHPPCALVRLTTTQRMKEFRTPSESVVKERGTRCRAPRAAKRFPGISGRGVRHPKLDAGPQSCPASPFPGFAGHPSLFERRMVEVNGIEPMASWLQTRRSPN